ncbi:hypothetical protein [Catenuloplanes japonicus]|uniref:hypothetical protein n=1 Tax=Catenuloplanes japonicus TaxID=33876 RepID=UPI0005272EEA|nr:hypothetical protein [Catenuloplanes japonicus]
MVTLDVLAQNNFGDTRTGGLTGPMGALVIVLLAIATVFLIRSMNKRLRRLPESFDPPAPPQSEESDGERKVLDPTGVDGGTGAKEESGSAPKN